MTIDKDRVHARRFKKFNITKPDIFKFISCLLFILMLTGILSECYKSGKKNSYNPVVFSKFQDIPGVTEDEIAAINALRSKYDHFIYGMPLSTEAFNNENGEVRGFSALICEWLTELFNIPFYPRLYEWYDLLSGLESKDICFTGELTATPERMQIYNMTSAIISRPVKYFRLAGARSFADITAGRLLRCGFITNEAAINAVTSELKSGTFEVVAVDEFSQVYNALASGEMDVFYNSAAAEVIFAEHPDVVSADFYPLIYMPVSMSSRNRELAPVLSVMEKALHNGSLRHLAQLYNVGYNEYRLYKLMKQLTAEERLYIHMDPIVPLAAEVSNYPVSFYDTVDNEWNGIAFDVLKEVEMLTGLHFKHVSNERSSWSDALRMLDEGKASIITELLRTSERENHYLWPDTSFMKTDFVLISRIDHPNIALNEVLYSRVGLIKDYAHTALFHKWFPNHLFTVEFASNIAAFDALSRNEVDMVMSSSHDLLNLTQYLGRTEFKTNFLFDYSYYSAFGFNKEEKILHSIVDKAMRMIDTASITDQWMRRSYDYRGKLAEAQLPWLFGSSILFLSVLTLVVILFVRSKRTGRELEELVEKRTYELALQTTTLTTLFNSIPDLIFTKDLDLKFLHCNKALLEHFNKDVDVLTGRNDLEALGVSREEAEGYRDTDRRVIREGRPLTIEEHIPRHDGANPYYETIKMPLILDDQIVGMMGIARDITRRKEMEKKMASSFEYSKKLSNALARITKSQAISTGILMNAASAVAKEGCNALSAHRVGIWNFKQEEAHLECISLYDSFSGQFSTHEEYSMLDRQDYLKLLVTERLIVMNNAYECNLITGSNNYYDHLCAALDAPVRVDGKLVGVVCVEQWRCKEYPDKREWAIEEQNFASSLADLMALAISNYERRKAREAAEMASQTKSSFLANMSHEIRTPMNAILGVTEILIQQKTLPSDIEEGLGKIYSSCDLLLGIINDILDFSKIEAGKLDINPSQYKVASMINDSVHLNMMRIESKPIEFTLQIDKNIPAKLIGDELRIKQILNNLLSNAFKYTESGKIILSVHSELIPLMAYLPEHALRGQVRWSAEKDGVMLVLGVRDTGCGMTKDQLGKMFDEYSRFIKDKNTAVEGTGLGLAITQRLVNLMDGEMHVESEPDKGSYFIVKLPQEKVDSEVIGRELADNLSHFRMNYIVHKERRQLIRDPMPYGSVMIVDDVETNLYVAAGLMKLYKLKIETVMSGIEAIKKIEEGNKYDIIFMDHMMPEMDGIETTKHLRDMGYNEPVVALTANAVAGQADMFIQNGFDDFISKPIDIRQLDAVLNKLVRDKQPPEVIEAVRRQKIETPSVAAREAIVDPLLIESFIRDARKTIAWLEDQEKLGYDDDEAMRKFTIIVHGIKSSLWNIGETVLSETAFKLEKSGRENNKELVKSVTPGFLKDMRSLLEEIESSHNKDDLDIDNADEDIESLTKKLIDIKEMCADFNRKGALDAITEIKNHSKNTREILEKIIANVVHSEFEEAEEIAAGYLDSLQSESGGLRIMKENIDGLDIAAGLERYNDDENVYIRILHSYAASVRSMLEEIESVCKPDLGEDNLNLYKIKVHGIKGTSLDICAGNIGNDAKRLEDAAKSSDLDYINSHNKSFLEETWKLVNTLEDLFVRLEAENPKPVKDTPDAGMLKKLYNACKDYDMDGADAAIAEIEKYKYESDNGLALWLRENMDRMNLSQIAKRLSEINGQGD